MSREKIAPDLHRSDKVTYLGVSYPLYLNGGIWRMQKRHRVHGVNFSSGTGNLKMAKEACLKHLADRARPEYVEPSNRTLDQLVEHYKVMPKRAGADAEKVNIIWLTAIVRETLGKTLANTKVDEICPKLWREFMALRQGGKLDLVKRRKINASINSAVRCACSIFIPTLRSHYKEAGFIIPADATTVQWLPTLKKMQEKVEGNDLLTAWRELKTTNKALWRMVGLARFAGLRQDEIMSCRGGWISKWKGQPVVTMHDREEEGYATKTGAVYRAMILDADLAADLEAVPADELVIQPTLGNFKTRSAWGERAPQRWLRKFMPASVHKPLHRMRGLYADELAEITQDATLARLEAVREASKALGHTSTKTTEEHYLS